MTAIVTGGYGSNENDIVTLGLGGASVVSNTLRGFASQPQDALGELSDNSLSAVGDQGQDAYGNIIGSDSVRRGGGYRPVSPYSAQPYRYLPLSGSAEQESDADGRVHSAMPLLGTCNQEAAADGTATAVLVLGANSDQISVSQGRVSMSATVGAYAMAEQEAFGNTTLTVSEDDEAIALLLLV